MIKKICCELEKLPTVRERLDRIGEYYSNGENILDGFDTDDLSVLLDVDLTGFSGDWEFGQVPYFEPDANSISQGTAGDVVSFLLRSDIDCVRLNELEEIAELIDESDEAAVGTIIERLGLTPDEIVKAINGARSAILEGDAGWMHLATLELTTSNGFVIEFHVTYDDCERNVDFVIRRSI